MRALTMILLSSFVLSSLIACSSTSTNTNIAQPAEDVGLSFVDENGNDRLDPEHENALSEDNLNIYYLKDGEKTRVYNSNNDYPKNFKISYAGDQEKYVMQLWLSYHMAEGYTTTFIEFPDSSLDTLKMQGRKESGSIWAEKLWYNGELFWNEADSGMKYLVITKPAN